MTERFPYFGGVWWTRFQAHAFVGREMDGECLAALSFLWGPASPPDGRVYYTLPPSPPPAARPRTAIRPVNTIYQEMLDRRPQMAGEGSTVSSEVKPNAIRGIAVKYGGRSV